MHAPRFLLVLPLFLVPAFTPASGAAPMGQDFRPDPRAVQRHGPAYRYPQAGWIVLHIEGEPYERGYQHGRLLAPEIAGYLRCFAALRSHKAPAEGWKNTRSLVDALFLRRFDKEYLEEMKGIADGASAAGARFYDRPIDLVDIAGLNCWPEIETLDSALEATPTGLEGMAFPHAQAPATPAPKPMHCSAFAATGPATADGKIVFGHITMSGLYSSTFCNIWLDVKPAHGHRVLMQTYPGGIQSGLDYYLNDAGLLVCETTLAQTRFDGTGLSVASRIRQALQYGDTIDRVIEVLKTSNNGLYTNEWLLGDTKTNEIAMFELGTAKSKLYRSSKNEWFGGTEGFYWGCNNTKDLDVRLETVPGMNARPANVVWHPSDRDRAWLKLYAGYRGKIDVEFGKVAFTTPPVAASHSLDAKFTTTDLARGLKTWALFGPPLGRTWKPTEEERKRYPDIRPLVSNPWTVLHALPPGKEEGDGPVAADLPEMMEDKPAQRPKEDRPPTEPAWHGTLLPATDADVWLATGFADYERIAALEKALKEKAPKGRLTAAEKDRLAADLFLYRAAYLASARAADDTPLAQVRSALARDDWYRLAAGKGVLVLHELHRLLGDSLFQEAMDSFGRENAGKEVTSAQFQAHVDKVAGKSLAGFFDYWLRQPGLPALQLGKVQVGPAASEVAADVKPGSSGIGYLVQGEITRDGSAPPTRVDVTVETSKGEVSKTVEVEGLHTAFAIHTAEAPVRVIVDKYGRTAKANGGAFDVLSFYADLENALIVYGTTDEACTNREAAEELQRAIRERWSNETVPVMADTEVTDQVLKAHHVLLVGRPDSNRVVERFRSALPVGFGSQSFTVRQEVYAHPNSAVIAAGENPLNRRYSIVVFAGLGGASTLSCIPAAFHRGHYPGEVIVLANGALAHTLVVPARELVHDLAKP